MKVLPKKVGAEPKKLAILGGLVVVLLVVFLINRSPDVPDQQAQTAPAPAPASPAPLKPMPTPAAAGSTAASLTPMPPQRTTAGRRDEASIQDFKPTLKLPEGFDVSRIDPSLKLDLLAKLQASPMEGGDRSLFEFGAPPKPKTPIPSVQPIKPGATPADTGAAPGASAAKPAAPAKPAVPPLPFKFYGYESRGTSKRAFFLDGDDIIVAGENDMIHNRYKVIRIGINSAVIEDTQSKNQQTLPLVEELQG